MITRQENYRAAIARARRSLACGLAAVHICACRSDGPAHVAPLSYFCAVNNDFYLVVGPQPRPTAGWVATIRKAEAR